MTKPKHKKLVLSPVGGVMQHYKHELSVAAKLVPYDQLLLFATAVAQTTRSKETEEALTLLSQLPDPPMTNDEYKRQHQPLLDEYKRQQQPLWEEYECQREPLWEEYRRQERPLWEEYARQQQLLREEYARQEQPLLEEYEHQRRPLWEEYRRQERSIVRATDAILKVTQ